MPSRVTRSLWPIPGDGRSPLGRPVREQAVDPMVYRGVNGEPIAWHRENDPCSAFLVVMLWHGTNGGAPRHTGTAPMPEDLILGGDVAIAPGTSAGLILAR
jgi:hypothetical protein